MRAILQMNSNEATRRAQTQIDTWRSPVPYLYGGIAALLALIAAALLVLACIYWREGGDDSYSHRGGDQKRVDDASVEAKSCFAESVAVIMAGDDKPTFLATPAVADEVTAHDAGVVVKEHGTGDQNASSRRQEVTVSILSESQ